MDLLDTPIRLTWDCPGAVPGRDHDLSAIARQIDQAGVFYVTLYGCPLETPQLLDVLSCLENTQTWLRCSGETSELSAMATLPGPSVQILLDLLGFINPGEGIDKQRLTEVLSSLNEYGAKVTPYLTPLRSNLHLLPDLIRYCSQANVSGFKLPNAHIGDSFHGYSADDLPRWQDLEVFRRIWSDFAEENIPMPTLEIHDLFLWEIMTPGEQQNRSEYGGCQAANSLGHIDAQGVVHPCAAWPHPLGRLPDQTLEEVWSSPERLKVRGHIASTPPGCLQCQALEGCMGGCRGLAQLLNQASGERDLMCSGPRK